MNHRDTERKIIQGPRRASGESGAAWEQFPCNECGGTVHFAPGRDALVCVYCGHANPIPADNHVIEELDYVATLSRLVEHERAVTELTLKCDTCGAEFRMAPDVHAGHCDFCGSTIVADTTEHRQLPPEAVLPFQITQKEADESFVHWLGKLWLAPNALKQHVKGVQHLSGVYVPYWTFDSQASAEYRGERGTFYQVREQVMVNVNGRMQMRTQMVTKVRWTQVSGRVARFFDDVLVPASNTLPKAMLNRLRTWTLTALKRYQAAYLAGFKSELYQVTPEQGFVAAREVMDNVLRNDIVRDIGGDLQRITHMRSAHRDVHFKHILLPIWAAAYRFRGKSYRFVVNGQTGEVQGERPWSFWKIASLVLLALIALLGVFWAVDQGYIDLGGSGQVGGAYEMRRVPIEMPGWPPPRW
ncbi:MAG: primosomal protein N' (replication factor Y) - superfamily II helicase [Thiotrichales bacterium]